MKAGHKSNRKLPENIGVPPLTAASPSCTIASTPSPALAAPPRQPIAHAAPAPRQPLAHAAPPPHQPSAHAAPTHQQHVHDSWTGRGRARGSDHYTNSRGYFYFTAGLEA